ncbi:acyl carrier protein [Antricoccus suffuscus]|uniref:Acyl carrier protein n=2 Tax=Antricoccus suffuscus TaxID=1629062 RepID=A0A2T1A1N5_9ACTN|nr:acyl carrier protein [Antricoccus suffuscus]
MDPMDADVRSVLSAHGRLPIDVDTLSADADLYRAGLTSHASVNVMLALEDTFDVEFPDSMLRKSTFESITAITAALTQLGAATPSRV